MLLFWVLMWDRKLKCLLLICWGVGVVVVKGCGLVMVMCSFMWCVLFSMKGKCCWVLGGMDNVFISLMVGRFSFRMFCW